MVKDKTLERLGYKKKKSSFLSKAYYTSRRERKTARQLQMSVGRRLLSFFLIIKAPSHLAVNQFKPGGEVGWCSFCVLSRTLTSVIGREK